MKKNTKKPVNKRMITFDTFVERSNKKHNNKYIYDASTYTNVRTHTVITCPVHGEFKQIPHGHMNGQGCRKCAFDKVTIKQEDFEARVKAVHGDKYDLSKAVYINNRKNVTLICPIHGEFSIRPDGLFKGRGCNACGYERMKKGKDFYIKLFRKKFGDKYKYSVNEPMLSNRHIVVTCPIHGDSLQTPVNHLESKTGCRKCGTDNKKLSLDEFITKAKEVHGDLYRYDKSIYVDTYTELDIYCTRHKGYFKQRPVNHLSGYGCTICAGNSKRTTEDFIRDAKVIHGDIYDYSKVIYNGNKEPVTLICKEHGEFTVKPNAHLVSRSGCPICSASTGEVMVRDVLDKYNLSYKTEHMVKKTKRRFRYDFYLPDFNIFIEYNGKQHYEPNEFFGGIEEFKIRRKNDISKKRLVWRLGGNIITIRYTANTVELIRKALILRLKRVNKIWVNDKGTIRAFKNFHHACKFYNLPGSTTKKTVLQELSLLGINSIF